MRPSRALALAAALTIAPAACGDGTAPRQTTVEVNLVEQLGPTESTDPELGTLISCEVELSATGSGQGAATWVDATFRIFRSTNPSTPVQTTAVSAEVLNTAWGAEQIAAGEVQTSRWAATVSFPFSATMDFRYRASPGGAVLTASTGFTCIP